MKNTLKTDFTYHFSTFYKKKGKTTLLNVLNFRNRGNLKITGDVKINGQVIKSTSALAAISGYVQQEDLYVGTLKVGEQLRFQVTTI